MPAQYCMEVHIGDSWPPGPMAEFPIVIRQGNETDGYNPVDLTEATATATIYDRPGDETPEATFQVSIPTPTDGTVLLRLLPAESLKLTAKSYHWELTLEWSATDRTTFLAGDLVAKRVP